MGLSIIRIPIIVGFLKSVFFCLFSKTVIRIKEDLFIVFI